MRPRLSPELAAHAAGCYAARLAREHEREMATLGLVLKRKERLRFLLRERQKAQREIRALWKATPPDRRRGLNSKLNSYVEQFLIDTINED